MQKYLKLIFLPVLCVLLFTSCSSEDQSNSGNSINITISCATVFDNLDLLDSEKLEILPEDGVIYQTENAYFKDSESVYEVIINELKNEKIHFEADSTYYIKGINNLYNGDAGAFSGWLYKINGEFPETGLNNYYPENGDVIELLYSCDFGKDIGMEY